MKQINELNCRVLIIDDEESVCDSFLHALGTHAQTDDDVTQAMDALFDDAPSIPSRISPYHGRLVFEVDVARNGRQGYEMVKAALDSGRPYAVVFTDIRMPGWSGLETVQHIRKIDERCEVIFVTAYSDYEIDTLVQVAGPNVGYFLKPFAIDEVRQFATKAVIDWNKAREMERLLATLSSLDVELTSLEELLRYLLGEICQWLGTDSGALAQITEAGELQFRVGRGRLARPEDISHVTSTVLAHASDEPFVSGEYIILPINKFGVAIAVPDTTLLTPERMYLLRFFLKHAALAIRNSESRAQLAEARRLSALGEALGYVAHDLRGPLGTARALIEQLRLGDDAVFDPEEIYDLLDQSIIHAEAVANDTLDLVRGTLCVNKQPVHLRTELSRHLTMLQLELDRLAVPLRNSIPFHLTASIDTLPFMRALRNLAINAGEALRSTEDPWVEIGARAEENGICIWVADNGPGLPEGIREHLFEPFTTAGKSQGTGLGLSMVKLIVDAHQGAITVHSTTDGTRFEIRLPA